MAEAPEWATIQSAVRWLALGTSLEPLTSGAAVCEVQSERFAEAKDKLVAALLTGKIWARGEVRISEVPNHRDEIAWGEADWGWINFLSEIGPERLKGSFSHVTRDVPVSLWRDGEIEWFDCSLRFRRPVSGYISKIVLLTRDLFAAFPNGQTPQQSAPAIEERRPPGAPVKYNWDAFHAEVAVRAHLDGLPDTLAELEREMAEWCDREWEKTPSESQMREKLAPIYRHSRMRSPGR